MRPTLPHTPQPNGLEHFGLQFVLVTLDLGMYYRDTAR